jgi:hypothetical protein
MSAYLNAAIAELKDLIVATWPEIGRSGGKRVIYEAEHVATVPLEELVEKWDLPYAVLVIDAQPWLDGPITQLHTQLDVEIYYLIEAPGKPNALREPLEALRDALWEDETLALSQVWDDPPPAVSWSIRMDINRLLRGKKLPLLAGRVSVRLMAGEPEE